MVDGLDAEERRFVEHRQNIAAIKHLRSRASITLGEAKASVDAYIKKRATPDPSLDLLLSQKTMYSPRHVQCDLPIGRSEETHEEIERKFDAGEYGNVCPSCHNGYLDSMDDLKIVAVVPRS